MFRVRDAQGGFKYAGRSRAKVIDNRDPLNKGRIIVDHPILGKTVWIDYLRQPHQFDVPSIGDIVYLECDSGVYEFPIAWGNLTKGTDAAPEIPAAFKRDIPTNRGLFTPGGHLFEMDDGEATITQNPDDKQFTTSKRGIRITSLAGNKIHVIEDAAASAQYILLQDAGGNLIKLDYKNNQLTVNSIGKTKIDTTGNKDETVGGADKLNVTGDKEETIGGKLKITVTGDCDVTCTKATVTSSGKTIITASEVNLNGSTGQVLTNVTDPVVDLITGVPTMGVPTVKAG